MRSGSRSAAPLVILALLVCAGGAAAEPPDPRYGAALAAGLDLRRDALRRDDQLERLVLAPGTRRSADGTLDLSPLAQRIVACVRGWGIPLSAHRVRRGRKLALSALLTPAGDMPVVQLHVGASAAEPFGAFYQHERGFRLSVIYPVRNFMLRLEGGRKGEYGNIAMAGLQWVRPDQRFAAGFGMPVMLGGRDGAIGAVLQMRLKFD